jgi:hypothetical protein
MKEKKDIKVNINRLNNALNNLKKKQILGPTGRKLLELNQQNMVEKGNRDDVPIDYHEYLTRKAEAELIKKQVRNKQLDLDKDKIEENLEEEEHKKGNSKPGGYGRQLFNFNKKDENNSG